MPENVRSVNSWVQGFWLVVLGVAVVYCLSHDQCVEAVIAAGLFGWMVSVR